MSATVAMLLNKDGRAVSVWAAREEAEERARRYNADPFVEPGTTDPDAPYTVEVWALSGQVRS